MRDCWEFARARPGAYDTGSLFLPPAGATTCQDSSTSQHLPHPWTGLSQHYVSLCSCVFLPHDLPVLTLVPSISSEHGSQRVSLKHQPDRVIALLGCPTLSSFITPGNSPSPYDGLQGLEELVPWTCWHDLAPFSLLPPTGDTGHHALHGPCLTLLLSVPNVAGGRPFITLVMLACPPPPLHSRPSFPAWSFSNYCLPTCSMVYFCIYVLSASTSPCFVNKEFWLVYCWTPYVKTMSNNYGYSINICQVNKLILKAKSTLDYGLSGRALQQKWPPWFTSLRRPAKGKSSWSLNT